MCARGASRAASASHVGATGARTTSPLTLRCASSGSSVTTATRRARAVERPRCECVLAERRRPDDENGVERLEDGAEPGTVRGQVPREARVVLGEPGPGAERLLPDRSVEPFRDLDERVPGALLVRPGADDDGGPLRRVEQLDEHVDRGELRGAGAKTLPAAAVIALAGAGASQSSIGTMTSAGPHRVVAACHARSIAPGMSCGLTGCSTETGYVPASPSRRPARNGSWAR